MEIEEEIWLRTFKRKAEHKRHAPPVSTVAPLT